MRKRGFAQFARSDGLKINAAALDLHIKSNKLRTQQKWYDDVVIATTYVGLVSKQK